MQYQNLVYFILKVVSNEQFFIEQEDYEDPPPVVNSSTQSTGFGEPDPNSISVKIRKLDASEYIIPIQLTSTVLQLKNKIHDDHGDQTNLQRLICHGKILFGFPFPKKVRFSFLKIFSLFSSLETNDFRMFLNEDWRKLTKKAKARRKRRTFRFVL